MIDTHVLELLEESRQRFRLHGHRMWHAHGRRTNDCFLDTVVGPSLSLTVAAQDIEFVRQEGHSLVTWASEEITGIGIPGHQTQGLLFPAAPDHDGRPRLCDRHRLIERFGKVIVLAVVRRYLARPHLQGNLQRLFESLEALARLREGDAERQMLSLVPARTDA